MGSGRKIPREEMEIFNGIMADISKEIDRINVPPVHQKGSFRQRKPSSKASRSKASDDKTAALEKRLENAESANDRLRRKNGELSNELARTKAKADDLAARNACLAEENASLKKRLASLRSAEESESRIEELASENSALRSEAGSLRSSVSGMEAEIGALSREIARLKAEAEKLKAGIPLTDVAGKIGRISATEFESELFSGPRYEVKIARDGSYMTFKADVEGGVPCENGTLALPALPDLIGFSGPRIYDAYHYGGKLKIILRRR